MCVCVCVYPLIVMEQCPKCRCSHRAGFRHFTVQTAQQHLHGFVWKTEMQIIRGVHQLSDKHQSARGKKVCFLLKMTRAVGFKSILVINTDNIFAYKKQLTWITQHIDIFRRFTKFHHTGIIWVISLWITATYSTFHICTDSCGNFTMAMQSYCITHFL